MYTTHAPIDGINSIIRPFINYELMSSKNGLCYERLPHILHEDLI